MTTAWSRNGLTLTWSVGARVGAVGSERHELYAGRIYVGDILQLRRTKRWSMVLMLSNDGEEIGLRDTEQEARDGLVDAAVKALFGEEA